MRPAELVDIAEVPGGPPLRLVTHAGHFMIMLERNELMSTRMSGSEKALGHLSCRRMEHSDETRVLIGGYGMGFTLRAVLSELGPQAQVIVAELVPKIIDWARGPMQSLTAGCLDDPRVEIRIDDVGAIIAQESARYDAILLDVDNGPDGLTREGNEALYDAAGLRRAYEALRPGGLLAVWSAGPDPAFTHRLGRSGFAVDEVRVRARENGKGPMHHIWFGKVR